MKAPLSPPTELEANRPPFLTASFNSATAAVEPGAPIRSMPSRLRIVIRVKKPPSTVWLQESMLPLSESIASQTAATMPG